MAIKKEVEINIDTKKAVKSMEELGGSFEYVYGEIDPLSTKISEMEDRLYEMAGAGDTSSAEFKNLTQEVGRMKKVIIDTDLAVDGMSQTVAQNLGGALNGVTGAFALGTGAMGAMGVESEKVEEMLLRVQSAMAISQGIQSIREAIPSFKALGTVIAKTAIGQKALNVAQAAGAIGMKILNAVMNLNPVFLMVTAFAALGAAIAYFATQSHDAAEKQEQLNAAMQRTEELIDETARKAKESSNQKIALLQLEKGKEKEVHEEKLKLLKIEEQERLRQMIALTKGEKELFASKERARKQGDIDLANEITKEIEANREKYKELEKRNKEYNNKKTLQNETFAKEEKARIEQEKSENKAKYDTFLQNKKDYEAKRLAATREIEAIELALLQDTEFKAIEVLNAAARIKEQDILSSTSYTEEEKEKLIKGYEAIRVAEEQRIRDEYLVKEQEQQDKIKELKAQAILPPPEMPLPEEDVEVVAEELKGEFWLGVREKWRKKDEESNEEYINRLNDMGQSHLNNVMQGLQAIMDLSNASTELALTNIDLEYESRLKAAEGNAEATKSLENQKEAAEEAARKKGFERSKKLQLTMAVITGIQGVMAAFTAGSSMGPAGVVMGPLMAALAAVTAGVNIAKIARTKYEGGGGGGGGSAPRAPSIPNPANFNVVGNDGNNQLAESLGGQQPVQAYVVGSEVTTQQSLDRNKIENASLGG